MRGGTRTGPRLRGTRLASRQIPGAAAFAEGKRVSPLPHGGFQPAYEALAGALAAASPVLATVSPPGCGKSTLLGCLPMFKPDAVHARLLPGEKALLSNGETVPVSALGAAATAKGKAGLVITVELHACAPLKEAAFSAARLLFDLPAEGVQVAVAGDDEMVGDLLSQDVFAAREPVTMELQPVPTSETLRYIRHRLSESGTTQTTISADAASMIGLAAGGIPTRINSLCRKLFTRAFLESKREIDTSMVEAAANA